MAWKIILAVVVLFILITVYSVVLANRCIKQMDNSKKIVKGMDENEMLNLMGKDHMTKTFNESDNSNKYVWKINPPKNYKGIKEVTVVCKNGKTISKASK